MAKHYQYGSLKSLIFSSVIGLLVFYMVDASESVRFVLSLVSVAVAGTLTSLIEIDKARQDDFYKLESRIRRLEEIEGSRD